MVTGQGRRDARGGDVRGRVIKGIKGQEGE